MIQQMEPSRTSKLKQKFQTISFKNKFMLVFIFSSLVTLIATSIAMIVLIINFGQQDLNFITQQNKKFNQQSTVQVVQSLATFGMCGRDISTTLIYDLSQAYCYFSQRKDIYKSLQTNNPYFPHLSSSFSKPQFIPSLYFFTQNSTYYQDSFFDTIMLLADRSHYRTFRRINIIYYNTENTSDIMARTLPATNDFIIKKPEDVASRFYGLQIQYVDRTNAYLDTFSKKDNNTQLIALRSFLISKHNPKVKILIQVQLKNSGLPTLVQQAYYFPSTNALFIQLNGTTGQWFVSSSTKKVDFDITPMVQPGIRTIFLENGTQVIAGTVGFLTHIPLNSLNSFTYSNETIQRFVLITQTSETQVPYSFMESLINKLNNSIFTILVVWFVFFFILCICMALAVAKNIFEPLKLVSEMIKDYIQSPKKKGNIIKQLYSIPIKGVLKQLIKRIVQIIRKIQSSKKQIETRKKIKLPTPLNICQKDFQIKNGIIDHQILEKVQRQLATKYKREKLNEIEECTQIFQQ